MAAIGTVKRSKEPLHHYGSIVAPQQTTAAAAVIATAILNRSNIQWPFRNTVNILRSDWSSNRNRNSITDTLSLRRTCLSHIRTHARSHKSIDNR